MKLKFSAFEYVFTVAVIGLAVYGFNVWGAEAMTKLRAWFPRMVPSVEAPAPQAAPLTPLVQQIPLCRKEGPGFQACMFKAGYAVNAAWSSAHKADTAGAAGTLSPARATEVVNDAYRAGPSPVYGVPYWVPRPPPAH